mmetsp:Transcript_28847/g.42882  ORF Transcript_28847/g.42882 Transcript_28847/m.42882 type:complete len:91 (+) Transcript_28847:127-399(+)
MIRKLARIILVLCSQENPAPNRHLHGMYGLADYGDEERGGTCNARHTPAVIFRVTHTSHGSSARKHVGGVQLCTMNWSRISMNLLPFWRD